MNIELSNGKVIELKPITLKGKIYLPVAQRVYWFRQDHPKGSIETSFVINETEFALAKAIIFDETKNLLATGHKHETPSSFPDFLEKAETGAIGRALALCGYGTQFATELDEGEHIVDSPIEDSKPLKLLKLPIPPPPTTPQPPEAQPPLPKAASAATARDNYGDIPNNFEEELIASQNFVMPGSYIIKLGKKYKGKMLKEVPIPELESFMGWLHDMADKEAKPISAPAKEFIQNAYAYIQEKKGGLNH